MPRGAKGLAAGTGLPRGHSQAIRKLVGQPLAQKDDLPESPAAQLLVLYERLRELKFPQENQFKTNFTLFRTRLCWTKDEAAGGRVALLPDYPYLREVDEALLTLSPLLIEKSRRTLISWTVCAFGLWLLAGGQDPRWPELLHSDENRKVVIASRKLEGLAGSAEYLDERVRFMVDQFEEHNGRKLWPEFPEFKWRFDRGVATNGSIITAVPQGPDQMRGAGITFIQAEELGFWTEAKASIAAALQTLRGGGKFCGITTANAGSYASIIASGKVRTGFA